MKLTTYIDKTYAMSEALDQMDKRTKAYKAAKAEYIKAWKEQTTEIESATGKKVYGVNYYAPHHIVVE